MIYLNIAIFVLGIVIGGILIIYVYEPIKRGIRQKPLLPYELEVITKLESNLNPMLIKLMDWFSCPIKAEEVQVGSHKWLRIPQGKEEQLENWFLQWLGGQNLTLPRQHISKTLGYFHKVLEEFRGDIRAMPLLNENYPRILSITSFILDSIAVCRRVLSELNPNSALSIVWSLKILGSHISRLIIELRTLQQKYLKKIKYEFPQEMTHI